jgi:hypothetical protein
LPRHPQVGGIDQPPAIVVSHQFPASTPRRGGIQTHDRRVESGRGVAKQVRRTPAVAASRGYARVNQEGQRVAPGHMLALYAPGIGLSNPL